MPAPDRLLAFTLAAVVLIVVPGPSVLFVISRALAYGRRAALTTVVGGACGSFALVCAVAVGLGAIVQGSALAYSVIKLVGAAYLIYLGIRAFAHRRALRDALEARGDAGGDRRTWWQGFVVGFTNPKTAVFFAAVLPQFVDRSAGHASGQMLVLGAIFTSIVIVSDGIWGMTAGAIRAWFARSERGLERIGGAAGLIMVGLGVSMAVSGRKD